MNTISQGLAAAGAYGAQTLPASREAGETSVYVGGRSGERGDSVSISEVGRMLYRRVAGLQKESANLPGAEVDMLQINRLRDTLAEESSAFTAGIGKILQDNGIDVNPPVDLVVDGKGQVRVRGVHPEKIKIEALFSSNPNLRNQFLRVNAAANMIKAADEGAVFQEAYRKDAYNAVSRYSHLFADERKTTFLFRIEPDRMEFGFEEG